MHAQMTIVEAQESLAAMPGRDELLEQAELAVARAQRHEEALALVVLDLNRSTLSRAALNAVGANELMATVADRLSLFTRRSDVLAFLGSDLFAVLMPRTGEVPQIIAFTRRLLRLFDGEWELAGRRLHLSPAVGVAVYPEHGGSGHELFSRAVGAAHEAARRSMHHPLLADDVMQQALEERLTLETDLRQAIEQRAFVLHYQPQVNVRTGCVTRLEALVRWKHPERGLVPPEEFIPVAEETGFIVPLGAWVLEEAARQLAAWANAGHPDVRVSVNLDAAQLASEGLLELVDQVLGEHDLPPERLDVEITERTAIADARVTHAVLEELHRSGVRLTLDDFGTAYASLAMLLEYPFDTLKIDRSFIASIFEGDKEEALTSAVISLAHQAGMTVVVEGVETQEQLRLLRELGADEIQGYLYSPPLPASQCEPFLAGRCRLEGGETD